MAHLTGPTDVQTSAPTELNDTSNNPVEVVQSSTLYEQGNHGDVELSANVTGANVQEQINIAIAIDTSGSTSASSGTDFDGDGNDENILDAQLYAAAELFQGYVDAGYDPSEVSITLVDYSSNASTVGTFTLDEFTEFSDALQDMSDDGPNGATNYEAALEEIDDAWSSDGVDDTSTNLVVFMSDGHPYPGGQDFDTPSQALEADYGANILALGLGENSSISDLGVIDTSGSATLITSGAQLLSVVIEPLVPLEFEAFDVYVDGVLVATIDETTLDANGDPVLVTTALGWSFTDLHLTGIDLPTDLEVTVVSRFNDPNGGADQTVTTEHDLSVLFCFTIGTMILTPSGPQAIETLVEGDRVVTRDHGSQKIRWIGKTEVSSFFISANPKLRPVLFKKDSLGKDLPERDLRVSRQHKMLIRDWRAEVMFGEEDGLLTPAFTLINDTSIIEERPEGAVTYIHMAFDDHEVVYAEGVESESFHPTRQTIDALSDEQREELFALFPVLEDLKAEQSALESARPQLKGYEGRLFAS